jgi:pimeloyl-ACP methyl ester carboxylesterase
MLLATISACGGTARDEAASAAPPSSTTEVRPTTVVDELVEVDGARLHARCEGTGDTTVVLIAGFGDGGEAWGSIPAALSAQARVCSYDRYGTGTSDSPPGPQSFTGAAADLHTLLTDLGEVGPYLAVGHSFGGAEAVAFASAFSEEVNGLVLVDASPVGWIPALCAVPDDGSEAAAGLQQLCTTTSHAVNNPERLDGLTAFAEVGRLDNLGDLPTVVVTAAEHPRPGLDPGEDARLDETWDAGQDAWAALSSDATILVVPDTGHYIHVDQPQVVIQQIQSLLT